jgi:acetylornithine deacetylase/succinyl-diaminopimelate desuccinylase-like protein
MRNTITTVSVAISLLTASLLAQESKSALARDLLRELVEIDTTPANGCTKAAEAMAAHLRAGGFGGSDVLLLGARPDRQNLVARLRGRGSAKPILFIAHLDVVAAPREGWNSDPFKLTERDGFFYGRGVGDVKYAVAQLVANLIRLRAERYAPDRDILVALTADEEAGRANGVAWLLAERPDLMDVAYCLNLDAGGGFIEKGKRLRMAVQTCEKTYLSFRIETKSQGGHSSLPTNDNAIYRLATGLTRLAQYQFPFRFNETTRAYFARLSRLETGTLAADLRAVAQNPPDLDAARRLSAESPYYNAILHTTCVATRMQAGHANNALPQSAEAVLNCRVFPGDTLETVRSNLVQVLDDPQIELTPLGSGRPSPVSPQLPEVMTAVEKLSRERWPEVPVLPVMDPWSGDSARLRRAGIATFGVTGTFAELDFGNAHGANERLPVACFNEGTEFLYDLMKILTTSK